MISSSHHPYDYFDAMERLKNDYMHLDADERRRLKNIVAINASDPRTVEMYVDITGDDWAHIYPDVPPPKTVTTGQAIDKFLETYGKSSPEEDALLEKLIFNPIPDYTSMLARDEKAETPENMARLAKEINSPVSEKQNHPAQPSDNENSEKVKPVATEPFDQKSASDTPLTLELAKIFVKQGHFERAHYIISKIILNNPEKSVYFADQMRFLEKLIKIQKMQKAKSQPE